MGAWEIQIPLCNSTASLAVPSARWEKFLGTVSALGIVSVVCGSTPDLYFILSSPCDPTPLCGIIPYVKFSVFRLTVVSLSLLYPADALFLLKDIGPFLNFTLRNT
jgi:hypothetical protein